MSNIGRSKIGFCNRLKDSHHELADYFDIKQQQRDRWEKGRACQGILEWLEGRQKFHELRDALLYIERNDLVNIAEDILREIESSQRTDSYVSYSPTSDELTVGIARRGALTNGDSSSLTNERHRRIEYAKSLIREGQFSQAVKYLEDLKGELWFKADSNLKYRLLANLGLAKLGLDEISEAAEKFVEALQYNPEDDQAIAYAAMGFVFQNDYDNAQKNIELALQKNPANALAYSLRVRLAPDTDSMESVQQLIPSTYRESPDVLVALGELALNRKLYTKAEQYWQSALDSKGEGMDIVKAFLGVALLEPITKDYLSITSGQISDAHKNILERAIALFTEVLGGTYVNPNDLTHLKFTALSNRASALRLLGRYDDAIHDFKIACVKEPEDPYLIKQLAALEAQKGNFKEAYKYIIQIISSPKTPEAFLLAATSLIALNRFDEAESILNNFSQTVISESLKLHAKHLKIELFFKNGEYHKAKELLQEVSKDEPENLYTIVLQIQLRKHIGLEEQIPELIKQAQSIPFAKNPLPSHHYLADILYSLKYYRDAAAVFEQFVDKSLNTELSWQLLQSYYYAGNFRDALDLSQELLNNNEPSNTISGIAANIFIAIGDVDAARKTCEDYLSIYPDEIVMQLQLASVNYATGKYEKLDKFLDSKPNTKNLSLDACKKLALLYKVRDRIDKFLEVIYEMRHRFFNDGQVHVFYQISYLEATKSKLSIPCFRIIQDGCGVLVSNEFGKEQWYIIDDQPDSNFAQDELNSSQPLYQTLIGKNIGDEIVQVDDQFGRKALKIVAITDKYYTASQQSYSVLENQPDIKNFRMIDVSMDGDNISSIWLKQFFEGLQENQDHFDTIKSDYIIGKIPFGAFAIVVNRNPINLWQILASGSTPFIHSWTNFKYEKFEDALITLQKGGLVVIDPISLITLHHLRVADDVIKLLGKFGIAQSTINLFLSMVETLKGFITQGFATIGVEDGQGIMQEQTPEEIILQKNFFEKIIEWVRTNCLVLPCQKALSINNDERNKLSAHIGEAFLDTVLIASEEGRILYSDDQWLRWYARSDSGVLGVWTQVVLQYCLVQQNSNDALYRKAMVGLTNHGYTYTIIDAGTLMESVKLTEWKLHQAYTLSLKAIANENTTFEYAVSVSAKFLRQLYLEEVITDNLFIDPLDALVFELLKILTAKHSTTNFVEKLKQAIRKEFIIIPLQERKVLDTIDSWVFSQTIITLF